MSIWSRVLLTRSRVRRKLWMHPGGWYSLHCGGNVQGESQELPSKGACLSLLTQDPGKLDWSKRFTFRQLMSDKLNAPHQKVFNRV